MELDPTVSKIEPTTDSAIVRQDGSGSAPADRLPALTAATFLRDVGQLIAQDADLAAVVARWGPPPFWTHPPGFGGLISAILAQQVSLESAQAAFARLERAIGPAAPAAFLTLDDGALKAIGFSRQKASYVRGLAQALLAGRLDLDAVTELDDAAAAAALMQIRGVGAWTASAYLLFALRRPDAWPSGDLALIKAIQALAVLPALPSWQQADAVAERWRPRRAAAARILWHQYLAERGRSMVSSQ